jgi:hypothetical protein
MSAQTARARLCSCEHPLLDAETCLRCGRATSLVPEPARSLPRAGTAARGKATWTQAGVARAITAFAFFRGRAPVHADWNQRMAGWPSLETVETLFGSLEAANRAAQQRKENPDVH